MKKIFTRETDHWLQVKVFSHSGHAQKTTKRRTFSRCLPFFSFLYFFLGFRSNGIYECSSPQTVPGQRASVQVLVRLRSTPPPFFLGFRSNGIYECSSPQTVPGQRAKRTSASPAKKHHPLFKSKMINPMGRKRLALDLLFLYAALVC
ncbi:hypothetical protein BCR43DRAFT_240766 [Syncephalastrum racemosum]|uniref:Uncharacterized protein n=1 Tax=Syncephalastrum racemosum TaxID=13706 RepID=A0A1X2HEW7_SYNRA|nr:hypothetical protein BCR43DRAFT_240766 [Syncephalastrum racemosum]